MICYASAACSAQAIIPPTIGPHIGTHAYHHSAAPLLGTGKIVYANRGDQSRAGFKAKPVVVPRQVPTTVITSPTMNGFKPWVKLPRFNKTKINLNCQIKCNTKNLFLEVV